VLLARGDRFESYLGDARTDLPCGSERSRSESAVRETHRPRRAETALRRQVIDPTSTPCPPRQHSRAARRDHGAMIDL